VDDEYDNYGGCENRGGSRFQRTYTVEETKFRNVGQIPVYVLPDDDKITMQVLFSP
jgi:hypothetical protein